jgi:acetyltransferase
MVRRLKKDGFTGSISMVNPNYKEVLGYPCYTSLADLPAPADLAVIAIRASAVPKMVTEVHAAGIGAALVFSTGFADAGAEGMQNVERLVSTVRDLDIAFCGPGSFGFAVQGGISPFSAGPDDAMPIGNVAVVAQSGGFANIVAYAAAERGFGFSHLIASGSEAMLSAADYLQYVVEDPKAEVMVAILEEIRNAPRFGAFLDRAMELGKPVVVLPLGRSEAGQRATSAHSGALAARSDVQEAFLRKHGAIVVSTIDDLVETVILLSAWKKMTPSVAKPLVVTISGGDCSLVLDLGADVGIKVPELTKRTHEKLQALMPESTMLLNPLDLGTRPLIERDLVGKAYALGAADPEVNMIITRLFGDADDVKSGIAASMEAGKPHVFLTRAALVIEKPLFEAAKAAGVPILQSPDRALAAVQRAVGHAALREGRKHRKTAPPLSLTQIGLTPQRLQSKMTETEALDVLSAAGVATIPYRRAKAAEEARAAAAALGYPVVVKVDSPDIEHKSEAGGVRLDIANEAALVEAVDDVIASAKKYAPKAEIRGVVVQPLRRAPLELIFGLIPDEKFGAAVLVGFGGLLAEMLGRTQIRIAPFGIEEAKDALVQLLAPGKEQVNWRGLDIDAAARLLSDFSRLGAVLLPHVEAIDINPVGVFTNNRGACALDCLILPRRAAEAH